MSNCPPPVPEVNSSLPIRLRAPSSSDAARRAHVYAGRPCMRYERSGPESGSSVPRSRQRRRVFMVVAAVVIALGGVLAGVVISNGSKKVVVIGALPKPYLEANALIQSLGAPAPLSMPSTTWPLAGDAL